MNSGKSTALLQAAYNYEERGQRVLLAKPEIDTKGADQIDSRLGVTRPVDFLVGPRDDLRAKFHATAGHGPVACLLVDEAQFFTAGQVDDLLRIAVLDGIPVLAYGIRTDFRTEAFPGSARLMEIAHSLESSRPSAAAVARRSSTHGWSGGGSSSTATRSRSTRVRSPER